MGIRMGIRMRVRLIDLSKIMDGMQNIILCQLGNVKDNTKKGEVLKRAYALSSLYSV